MMLRTKKKGQWVKRRKGIGVVSLSIFLLIAFHPPFSWAARDKIGLDLEWRPIKGVELPPGKPDEPRGPDGKTWTDSVTGMAFVWVPKGCFEMGCGTWTSDCDSDEKPVHEVCLDSFWMGKHEVTQGEWKKIMGNNPSTFKKGDKYPVERVSWNDAQEFIRRLNAKTGGRGKFRLPTEAEWEYACRSGGKPQKYAGGSDPDRVAWYGSNSGGSTHPVGTKAANGLGIGWLVCLWRRPLSWLRLTSCSDSSPRSHALRGNVRKGAGRPHTGPQISPGGRGYRLQPRSCLLQVQTP